MIQYHCICTPQQCWNRFLDGPNQENHEVRINITGRYEIEKSNDSEATPETEADAGNEIA